MTLDDYFRKLLPERDRKSYGPNEPEFRRFMSTIHSRGDGPLPEEYLKRWASKGWSHTGAGPGSRSYVYVLGRTDEYLKIGVSCDPIRRVAELTWALSRRIWIIAMWMHPETVNVEQTVRLLLKSRKHPLEAEWYSVSEKKMLATVARAMRMVARGEGKYVSGTIRPARRH